MGRQKTSGRVVRDDRYNMSPQRKFSANCFIRRLDELSIDGFNSFILLSACILE